MIVYNLQVWLNRIITVDCCSWKVQYLTNKFKISWKSLLKLFLRAYIVCIFVNLTCFFVHSIYINTESGTTIVGHEDLSLFPC